MTPDADAGIDAGPQLEEVTLHWNDVWRHEQGEDVLASDFTNVTIRVRGTGESLALEPVKAGVVRVGRPVGATLVVELAGGPVPAFVETEAREIDLSTRRLGRRQPTPAPPGMQVRVNWQYQSHKGFGDLVSIGPGLSTQALLEPPAPGDLGPYSQLFDYADLAGFSGTPGLIEEGDTVYGFVMRQEMVQTPSGTSVLFQTSFAGAEVNDVGLTPGGIMTIDVAFEDLQRTPLELAVDAAFFRDLVPRSLTPQQQSPVQLVAFANPWGIGGPMVFYSRAPVDALPYAVDYGNPFPASWPVVLHHSWEATVDGVTWTVNGRDTLANLSAETIVPLVGPVTGFTVDGKDALSPQLTSATPRIAWAPHTLRPDHYRVLLLHADGSLRARLHTSATEWTVPPGLLAPGDEWRVRVDAVRGGAPVWRPNADDAGRRQLFGVRSNVHEVLP